MQPFEIITNKIHLIFAWICFFLARLLLIKVSTTAKATEISNYLKGWQKEESS
jgi:hypothetical protein